MERKLEAALDSWMEEKSSNLKEAQLKLESAQSKEQFQEPFFMPPQQQVPFMDNSISSQPSPIPHHQPYMNINLHQQCHTPILDQSPYLQQQQQYNQHQQYMFNTTPLQNFGIKDRTRNNSSTMATAQHDANTSVYSQNNSGNSSYIQNFTRTIKQIGFEVRGSGFISRNPRRTPAPQDPLFINSVIVNNRVEVNSSNHSVTSHSNSSSVVNSPYGKISNFGPIGSFLPSSGRQSQGHKGILEEEDGDDSESSEETIINVKVEEAKFDRLEAPKADKKDQYKSLAFKKTIDKTFFAGEATEHKVEEKYQINQAHISVKNGPFRRPKTQNELEEKKAADQSSNSRPTRKKKRVKSRKKDWKAGGSNSTILAEENGKGGGKKLLDRIAPRNLNPRDFQRLHKKMGWKVKVHIMEHLASKVGKPSDQVQLKNSILRENSGN